MFLPFHQSVPEFPCNQIVVGISIVWFTLLWTDEKISQEFSNSSLYPTNKDIFSKLPKAYKLKSTPKKREEVIKIIIEHVNKIRSSYIINKV